VTNDKIPISKKKLSPQLNFSYASLVFGNWHLVDMAISKLSIFQAFLGLHIYFKCLALNLAETHWLVTVAIDDTMNITTLPSCAENLSKLIRLLM